MVTVWSPFASARGVAAVPVKRTGQCTSIGYGGLSRADEIVEDPACPLAHDLLAETHRHIGKLFPFSIEFNGSFSRVVRPMSGIADFHPHRLSAYIRPFVAGARGRPCGAAAVLGHASIVTTQRYARLTDEIVME